MKKLLFGFALLLPLSQAFADESSMLRQGSELGAQLQRSCGRPITVDLMDYAYGRDELMAYEYPGLEYCQRLVSLLEGACKAHSQNAKKLVRVSTLFCQRGSLEGPRFIVRKSGDLVLLAVNGIDDWEKWMRDELTKQLKLDFNANEQAEQTRAQELAVKKKEELEEKKRENAQQAAAEAQQKKIDALTAWFQTEMQKITAKPTPDMGPKLEKLSKEYQEKMDALTR